MGVRIQADFGWRFWPHLALGFAFDANHNRFYAFSLPAETDTGVALGVALAVGVFYPLGPGGLLLEMRYRESHTSMASALGAFGESTFANVSLHLGYLFAVTR